MLKRALFPFLFAGFALAAGPVVIAQRPGSPSQEQEQYLNTGYFPIEQYLVLLTYPEVQAELGMDLKQKATLRDWVFAPFMPRYDRAERFRNYTQQNMEFFNQMQIRGHLMSTAALQKGWDSYNVWIHEDSIRASQARARQSAEQVAAAEAAPRLSAEEIASHLRAVAQRIPDLLKPKQLERLSQLHFQLSGPLILTDRQVGRLLSLSQDQQTRIDNIAQLFSKRLSDLPKYYPELKDNAPTAVFGGREDPVQKQMREEAIAERRIAAMEKEKAMAEEAVVQSLSHPQQQAWASLLGRAFVVPRGGAGIFGALKR